MSGRPLAVPVSVNTGNLMEWGRLVANSVNQLRALTNYIKPTMTIAAGTAWTYAQGLEVNAAAGGGRR